MKTNRVAFEHRDGGIGGAEVDARDGAARGGCNVRVPGGGTWCMTRTTLCSRCLGRGVCGASRRVLCIPQREEVAHCG